MPNKSWTERSEKREIEQSNMFGSGLLAIKRTEEGAMPLEFGCVDVTWPQERGLNGD